MLLVKLATLFHCLSLVLGITYIDLSYPINNDTVYEPNQAKYERLVDTEQYVGGVWFATYSMKISEQTGTHVDAPYHVFKTGLKLDQILVDNFVAATGVKIDVQNKVMSSESDKANPDYAVTKKDLIEWELVHGIIPHRSIAFIHTGWDEKWGNSDEYLGTSEGNQGMNFPGLDSSAAKFLAAERNVIAVGIDTISVDPGYSKVKEYLKRFQVFPAHSIFAARGIYTIENVANLHLVPEKNFSVWVMPMKIEEASGAPVRIVAAVP